MKMGIAFASLAFVAGCSILGYRDASELKSEAKYRLSRQIDRDPVLVYRDVSRALAACTRDPVAGPARAVTSKLNRETDQGEVSLTHQGRYIARYEISRTGDGKAQVDGWWLPGALACQPML